MQNTISGFSLSDAVNMLERSIESSDAEAACNIAAELALTKDTTQILITHLIRIYSQWYVSVDMSTMSRIAHDIQMMAKLPQNSDARKCLCDMIIGLSMALPRQNAFEVLGGRVRGESIEPSLPPSSTPHVHNIIVMATRLGKLLLTDSTGAVRLAQQILNDVNLRSTPTPSISAAICIMWTSIMNAVADVESCKNFVDNASMLFHYGVKKGTTPNKRICTARRNLLLCAILVAAGSSTIRSGGPLPRNTWNAMIQPTLSSAQMMIDSIFDHIHRRHNIATEDQPVFDSVDSASPVPISYLRMYTTVDYDASASVMDTVHDKRIDMIDSGGDPKIITLRDGAGATKPSRSNKKGPSDVLAKSKNSKSRQSA